MGFISKWGRISPEIHWTNNIWPIPGNLRQTPALLVKTHNSNRTPVSIVTSTTRSQVAACVPPAMPYRLLNPKWPTGGPKMADGVWNHRVLGALINFWWINFLIRALLQWKKRSRPRKWKKNIENNGENSGPLSSLPVDPLTATDYNADRSCQIN